ncbi:hypothetical protein Blue_111 [Bacillus phage Deep Blue]|uniref:Uncharacterized protein n=1 Tax=Bacillus phage Deep Blue TaxID=1792245 RepID=A0A140HLS2_9CAUD|nr:hypothetical protein Blue_111 [Bacillus phage Deep Blue]AMO25934.1 hypothetical protein Blue_111 [Bacillus phage Deep Blue]
MIQIRTDCDQCKGSGYVRVSLDGSMKCGACAGTGSKVEANVKQFEYMKVPFHKLVEPHYQQLDVKKLNELGQEGWEIVVVASGECIFKRENLQI